MLDSPTFLYVIILFITIEIMYYYKLYLLYLLYTNNIQITFAATGLSLPNVTAAIIWTVLICLTGLFIGLGGRLTGLTELTCMSLAHSDKWGGNG